MSRTTKTALRPNESRRPVYTYVLLAQLSLSPQPSAPGVLPSSLFKSPRSSRHDTHQATSNPPLTLPNVQTLPGMGLLCISLFLAVCAAARGITEPPSAITAVAAAPCPLTNSIPACGVSPSQLGSLVTDADAFPDFMPGFCWRRGRLSQPV